jgi:hypothetical protein
LLLQLGHHLLLLLLALLLHLALLALEDIQRDLGDPVLELLQTDVLEAHDGILEEVVIDVLLLLDVLHLLLKQCNILYTSIYPTNIPSPTPTAYF